MVLLEAIRKELGMPRTPFRSPEAVTWSLSVLVRTGAWMRSQLGIKMAACGA